MTRKWLYFFLTTIDILIVCSAMLLAVFIRFEGDVPHNHLNYATVTLPLLVVIRLVFFYLFNLYNRIWRYASVRELLAIVGAVVTSSIVFFLYCYFTGNLYGIPRSVHIISMLFTVVGVGVSRLFVRIASYYRYDVLGKYRKRQLDTQNILIVGAGDAGAIVAKELIQNTNNKYHIVGFIDDNPNKTGMSMFGSKIMGGRDKIKNVVSQYSVDEIIIAIPSAEGQEIREISALCEGLDCTVKIVPGIYDLLDNKFTLAQLRSIEVEDLLRRKPVALDGQEVAAYLCGKKVLITGAGGSIGSEIARQVAKIKPQQLILLGKGENSIYEIEYDLRTDFPGLTIIPVIADVKDYARMDDIFAEFRPQVVFHAAAHKHVPLMERQPVEAVKNNIKGTLVAAQVAQKHAVERFIMISTDKAINPTSVMGASKRVAEMVVSSMGQSGGTIFSAVRFGNVLGSRGSVIPLFKKQIAAGGPVTITHPDMKRYFMTIPEASQLVLQAGAFATGGEIFVLDMGEPVKIYDLVVDLIKLTGYEPHEDIEIKYTGLRPGEKLFEELLTAEEGANMTKHSKIFIANMQQVDKEALTEKVEQLINLRDDEEIIKCLCTIVLTYTPNR